MKITAVTKLKQGDLWESIKRLGWSQSELARRCGTDNTSIGNVINLKKRPSEDLANKIQKAFAEAGEYVDITSVWPESFEGFKSIQVFEQTKDIDVSFLLPRNQDPLLALEYKEQSEFVEKALQTLTEKQREIIESRFYDGKTHAEVSRGLNVSKTYTNLVERKALMKLWYDRKTRKMLKDSMLLHTENIEDFKEKTNRIYLQNKNWIFREPLKNLQKEEVLEYFTEFKKMASTVGYDISTFERLLAIALKILGRLIISESYQKTDDVINGEWKDYLESRHCWHGYLKNYEIAEIFINMIYNVRANRRERERIRKK